MGSNHPACLPNSSATRSSSDNRWTRQADRSPRFSIGSISTCSLLALARLLSPGEPADTGTRAGVRTLRRSSVASAEQPPQSKEWHFIQSKELYHYNTALGNRHLGVFPIL